MMICTSADRAIKKDLTRVSFSCSNSLSLGLCWAPLFHVLGLLIKNARFEFRLSPSKVIYTNYFPSLCLGVLNTVQMTPLTS